MDRRLRRLRLTAGMRRLAAETVVAPGDLIYPLFVCEGRGVRRAVSSMPGIFNFSPDELEREAEQIAGAGLAGVLLFGIPDEKDDRGTRACDDNGVVQEAARLLKKRFPHLTVMTDVCLCEYTSHGHCGILDGDAILNDETVEALGRMAVSHARAGADVVAPSDMMDLRVGAIRRALDGAGFLQTPIMSYAAKYASCFYGPFRDAAQSAPASGDRKSHQMNPANAREALREAEADVREGADMLMVKPASHYLDIVRLLRERFDLPLAAYQVSGEYSMLKAAAANGWVEEPRAVWESLTCIKRAGADLIVTYFAKEFALGKLEYRY